MAVKSDCGLRHGGTVGVAAGMEHGSRNCCGGGGGRGGRVTEMAYVVVDVVFRITKHLNKQEYKKNIYCATFPTVWYQANTETSTQHARPFAQTFYRPAYGLIGL